MKKFLTILLLTCIIGMTSCSLRAESETATFESSSESQEMNSLSSSNMGESSIHIEPESEESSVGSSISASDAVQPLSIAPVVSAEAKPVALNITVSNPIASEMTMITDEQKAAEFVTKLGQVIPTERTFSEDIASVDILLQYSFDGGEHNYKYFQENEVDYIAVDGNLYQVDGGFGQWISDLVPVLPDVPADVTKAQIISQEYAIVRKASLMSASERVVWQPEQIARLHTLIAVAGQVERGFLPDTGGESINVTFQNSENPVSCTLINQQENGFGLMKQGENWYYVDEEAYSEISDMFNHNT